MKYKLLLLLITTFEICLTQSMIPKCCTEFKSFNSKFQCVSTQSSPNYLKTSLFKILNEHFTFSLPTNTEFNLPCTNTKSKKFKFTQYFLSVIMSDHSKFCVDMLEDQIHVLTCPCEKGTCVQVCCQPGYMLNTDKGTYCVPAPEEWATWSIDDHVVSPQLQFSVVYEQKPKCEEGHYPLEEVNVTVLSNGSLLYEETKKRNIKKSLIKRDEIYLETPNNYCIGVANNSDIIEPSALVCVPVEKKVVDNKKIQFDIQTPIYCTLFVIGAIFLLANMIVYTILPELRRNVQGLSLLIHCGLIFISYIGFIIIKACGRTLKNGSCHFIAYLVQYTFISGFCWMNVICIDIAAKFRSLQSMVPRNIQEFKKFKLYSIYAMGLPALIVIITILMNSSSNISESLRPDIGITYCWFNTDTLSIVLYFYGPISIVLLCNTALFIFTTVKIYFYTKDANRSFAEKKGDRKRFFLFVKLFSVMGVSWITEIISWQIGGITWYWFLTDGYNILRPAFIFVIFCCKKQVLELLKNKYAKIKGDFEQQYSLSSRSRGEQSFSNNTQTANTTSDMQENVSLDSEQNTNAALQDLPL